METITLDLTRDATRQHIYRSLRALLDEDSAARIDEALAPLRDSGGHFHDLREIHAHIDSLPFDARALEHAKEVYLVLAQAEAKVHGCALEETHFHEVGNAEAVANVLAVCLALAALGYPRITASAVQTGEGKVQCAHGVLDIPAPATAAILQRGIPVCAEKREGEWCTPTSAALLYHFVDAFIES